jgi:hypothetical protein
MATIYNGPSTIVGNYNPAFNIPQSSDLNSLRPIEVSQLFGQAVSAGDRVINSLKADILVGQELRSKTGRFAVGITTPVISSTNGNPLVIHSGNGVVNFAGATIINVAGIATDPNVYDLINAVTTVDAVPVVGLVIPTSAGAYNFEVRIVCESGADGGVIDLAGGSWFGTVSTPFVSRKRRASAPLNAIDAYFGPGPVVYVQGMPATTIRWRVLARVVRVVV